MTTSLDDQYKDSIDSKDIIETLYAQTNVKELYTEVIKHFPNWVKYIGSHGYCSDYSYLQRNWEIMCKKLGCKPEKIILVEYINSRPPEESKQYTVLDVICYLLTRNGYVVRRIEEFQECSQTDCVRLLPSQKCWEVIRKGARRKGIPIPSVWSDSCSNC